MAHDRQGPGRAPRFSGSGVDDYVVAIGFRLGLAAILAAAFFALLFLYR